jgi:hypothetical protein
MKLIPNLKAKFLRFNRLAYPTDKFVDGIKHTNGFGDIYTPVNTLVEAHGISFLCPKSMQDTSNPPNYPHTIIVWFINSPVPPDVGTNSKGKTVRWTATGSSLEDLTLEPSVHEQSEFCGWHGFVTKGDAT